MVVLTKQQLEAMILTITEIPDLEFLASVEFNVSRFSDGFSHGC
jgi:hypothetical protein